MLNREDILTALTAVHQLGGGMALDSEAPLRAHLLERGVDPDGAINAALDWSERPPEHKPDTQLAVALLVGLMAGLELNGGE